MHDQNRPRSSAALAAALGLWAALAWRQAPSGSNQGPHRFFHAWAAVPAAGAAPLAGVPGAPRDEAGNPVAASAAACTSISDPEMDLLPREAGLDADLRRPDDGDPLVRCRLGDHLVFVGVLHRVQQGRATGVQFFTCLLAKGTRQSGPQTLRARIWPEACTTGQGGERADMDIGVGGGIQRARLEELLKTWRSSHSQSAFWRSMARRVSSLEIGSSRFY